MATADETVGCLHECLFATIEQEEDWAGQLDARVRDQNPSNLEQDCYTGGAVCRACRSKALPVIGRRRGNPRGEAEEEEVLKVLPVDKAGHSCLQSSSLTTLGVIAVRPAGRVKPTLDAVSCNNVPPVIAADSNYSCQSGFTVSLVKPPQRLTWSAL